MHLLLLLLTLLVVSTEHAATTLNCKPHLKMKLDECQACIAKGYALKWVGKGATQGTGGCQAIPTGALQPGAACSQNSDCTSKICAGYCCASSCTASPQSTCGTTGQCDAGTGACSLYSAGTVCSNTVCLNGMLTPGAECPGAGEPCPSNSPTVCSGNFACATAQTCYTSCTDSTECETPYIDCLTTYCGICFAGSTTALRDDGAAVRMDALRIGDRVLAFDAVTGATTYSPVVFFSSAFANQTGSAVTVRVRGWEEPLVLSPVHLVLASRGRFDSPAFVRASDLVAGEHWTWMHTSVGDSLVPHLVEAASAPHRMTAGWYTPKTLVGTIIAGGFAASCHTEDHDTRESLYAPYHAWLRWFPLREGALPEPGLPLYVRVFRISSVGKLIDAVMSFVWMKAS